MKKKKCKHPIRHEYSLSLSNTRWIRDVQPTTTTSNNYLLEHGEFCANCGTRFPKERYGGLKIR